MTFRKVSIGIPVFNGEHSLRPVLDSLLAQTEGDLEIIISDNASSDQTEALCRAYAEKDHRIQYIRQPINLGAEANFAYVLERATCKYFMWAAADDVRSSDFIAVNLNFLETHPDYVCSISPVKFEGRDFDETQMGDRSLDDDQFDLRLQKFFGPWHANGAFFSLMRTEVIKNCRWVREWGSTKFLGADWVIVLYLAQQGKLNRAQEGWLELGIKGASNSTGYFRQYRSNWLDFCAPFRQMTCAALSLTTGAAFGSKLTIFRECLIMNIWALKVQILGRLYRFYKSLAR